MLAFPYQTGAMLPNPTHKEMFFKSMSKIEEQKVPFAQTETDVLAIQFVQLESGHGDPRPFSTARSMCWCLNF